MAEEEGIRELSHPNVLYIRLLDGRNEPTGNGGRNRSSTAAREIINIQGPLPHTWNHICGYLSPYLASASHQGCVVVFKIDVGAYLRDKRPVPCSERYANEPWRGAQSSIQGASGPIGNTMEREGPSNLPF
jgi:hypothetical protein